MGVKVGSVKTLWRGIKRLFHGLGLVQNVLLLAVFYFLLFGPMALIVRLVKRDMLDIRGSDRPSFWTRRPPEEPSLERARRQS